MIAVTEERRFKLPSLEAKHVLSTANALLTWCENPNHHEILALFAQSLTDNLSHCFPDEKSLQRKKERMWGLFHTFRTSSSFKKSWSGFLQATVGHSMSPGFVQYVTTAIFNELIKMEYTVHCSKTAADTRTIGPLTSEEAHALHYVAGYVCRKVKLHLDSTSKCDMSACLHDVVACDDDDDEWINLIDRGGLLSIKLI